MIFSSLGFFIFYFVVYITYWIFLRKHSHRMTFLLLASYFFYMTWSAKLVLLLIASTVIDFYLANAIAATEEPKKRKWLLIFSITANLTFLSIFKYTNFFLDSIAQGAGLFGLEWHVPTLNIVLPIAISFYTFESMSYTIDVYWRRFTPITSVRDYGLFVAYFPHLIAGPILRAKEFLPQLSHLPGFSKANLAAGLELLLLGLIKKVFVADRLAGFVDMVFGKPQAYDGISIWLGVIAYAFQIYCDFSGYSDMARGIGKTFNLDIPINFKTPYLSGNIPEFWQRWHISLSTWLRDYLFQPLGGYKGPRWKSYRNLFLTMFLGGLWHGASWTFVAWGALHGSFLIIYRLWDSLAGGGKKIKRSLASEASIFVLQRLFVFGLVCVGWVFFRCQTFSAAALMLSKMFFLNTEGVRFISEYCIGLIGLMVCYDVISYWLEKNRLEPEEISFKISPALKGAVYAGAVILLLVFSPRNPQPFIYFQF